jgi:transposase
LIQWWHQEVLLVDDLFLLSKAQMRRIEPFFPLSHGVPRVDDRLIVSAIVFAIRNGLRWRDASRTYGPHKPIYNRFIRWSRLGVFNRIFVELAGKAGEPRRDHDRCCPPQGAPDGSKPHKRGLNSKLHAVCDGESRPIVMMLTEGQMSDHKGAVLLFDALPRAKELLGDKGYDSDWFRAALTARGITPCIPPKSNRKVQYHYDKAVYKKRHLIENLFATIKDWRRIRNRYDRCAHTFMSAICLAATVIFWL